MSTKKKFSVIIPTYNSKKTLEKCLSSLIDQTYSPHEIIAVDGGSTDSTEKIIRRFDNVKWLINEKRLPGPGRNRGAETASGEILFFCDHDCVADKRVLEYHARAYKKRNDISGVMGTIGNASPKNNISNFVQREFILSQWLRSLNSDGTVKYLHTGTYNLSMYRSVFLQWRFPEDPTVSEDTELSMRLNDKVKIFFEPRAVMYHHHPVTLEGLFKQRKYYGERFYGLIRYKKGDLTFAPDSFFHSAMRFIELPEDKLHKAVFEDNRLLCEGCDIQRCRIDVPHLPENNASDTDICRVVCLAFSSGILKQRTGKDLSWP